MNIKHFFDENTFTLTYVVFDLKTKDAVVIDPVLDFDQASGKVTTFSFQQVKKFILNEGLKLQAILETHAHADHLSSSQEIKKTFPFAKLAISEEIQVVQDVFKKLFNIDYLSTDGSQFDLLLKDGKTYEFGSLKMRALATPGHTPACMSYLFGDAVFTGDALFMPDFGTGRCDFPKGSAKDLYHSVHDVLYNLPAETKVYVGHDYCPGGREMKYQTTIGENQKSNIQLKMETTEAAFIAFRESRDKTLSAPQLLLPSIQINADAGHLPPKESNGRSYLKLPLTKVES